MSKNSIPIKDLPLYIEQLCLQLQKMDYSESTCHSNVHLCTKNLRRLPYVKKQHTYQRFTFVH